MAHMSCGCSVLQEGPPDCIELSCNEPMQHSWQTWYCRLLSMQGGAACTRQAVQLACTVLLHCASAHIARTLRRNGAALMETQPVCLAQAPAHG